MFNMENSIFLSQVKFNQYFKTYYGAYLYKKSDAKV